MATNVLLCTMKFFFYIYSVSMEANTTEATPINLA